MTRRRSEDHYPPRVFEEELELERCARQAAESAARALEGVLQQVSHDLRNPLGVISMKAAVLLSKVDGDVDVERQQHDLLAILRNAERLDSMIADLLDYSGLRTGTLKLKRRAYPVAALVEQAAHAAHPLLGARRLRYELAACKDFEVLCDRERTLRVLSGLIGNAIQLTRDNGEIVISATPRADEVCFELRHDGVGASPHELAALSDNGVSPGASNARGVALGLMIARRFVVAQGGQIWATSRPGGGSVFGFTLPAQEKVSDTAAARILVVDDDRDLRDELKELFETHGYSVEAAGDGQAALAYLQANRAPALVLLDLMMPGMTGLELNKKMKTDPKLAAIPVVVVSCAVDASAPLSGVEQYLHKPLSTSRLLDLAEHYCS